MFNLFGELLWSISSKRNAMRSNYPPIIKLKNDTRGAKDEKSKSESINGFYCNVMLI